MSGMRQLSLEVKGSVVGGRRSSRHSSIVGSNTRVIQSHKQEDHNDYFFVNEKWY